MTELTKLWKENRITYYEPWSYEAPREDTQTHRHTHTHSQLDIPVST